MRIIIIGFFFIICGCIGLNAQQLRKWTNTEGKSFSGTIVDCDGVVAKYKIFGRKNLFELPLSELRPEDRRIAILTVFKPKYEAAVGHLRRESQKNIKDTLKLEKFGISEKSINEFFSTGLYKGLLDEGDPVLVLAMMSKTIPKPDINMGFFYKLTNGKGIELGIKTMNPPFVFGFIGMYENAKLKLDTTIELESKELTIVADTIYNLPDEVKNGFTLVRYFEITKINDNTYNEPYLAFIYKKKIDKDN